jgi:hypothetical protein
VAVGVATLEFGDLVRWKNMVAWKCVKDKIEVRAVGISRCVDSRFEMDNMWNMESLDEHRQWNLCSGLIMPTCRRAIVTVITTCLSGRDGESSAG